MASIWKEIVKKNEYFRDRESCSRGEERKRFTVILSRDNSEPLLRYWRADIVLECFHKILKKWQVVIVKSPNRYLPEYFP